MTSVAQTAGLRKGTRTVSRSEERFVIFASSLGTVFEWYDFYLYATLAPFFAALFFPPGNQTAALLSAFATYAAGFLVRPFGAIVFGRIGDLVGRKYTFLATIVVMGSSTALIGFLPTYQSIGFTAPLLLVSLRLMQGLALGGEYGGAATYVAEHAPMGKRGLHTSWIQTTATLGLFLSLLVILFTRTWIGEDAFAAWGWRVPFLISLILLAFSVYIRMKLNESPTFQRMKEEGKGSTAPLTESFARWPNLKLVLIALFGLTAGQAVVWYTGQFYALFFLTQTLKVAPTTANYLIAASLLIGTPCFILFGWLSDKIGRKRIIMAGCLLAVITYFPVFKGITHFANPALEAAQASAPVTVISDPATCSFQFNPVGTSKFLTSCDIAKSFLAKGSVNYENEAAPAGTVAQVKIGDTVIDSFEGVGLPAEEFKAKSDTFAAAMTAAVTAAGYPAKADPEQINHVMVTVLLVYLVILVTMVYGPIAATLVEMFPTKIRYTSMSLPYHIGNGWFGGFLPTISFALVAAQGDIYYGLWYPIVIAAMTFVVGMFLVHETKDHHIDIW